MIVLNCTSMYLPSVFRSNIICTSVSLLTWLPILKVFLLDSFNHDTVNKMKLFQCFYKVLMTSTHSYANYHSAKYGSNERVETRLIEFVGHVRYAKYLGFLHQLLHSTFTGIKESFTSKQRLILRRKKFILDLPYRIHRICVVYHTY